MSWQPIETAPQDGTVIDLWVDYGNDGGQRIPDGYWRSDPFPSFFDQDRREGWAAANQGYDGADGWADDPELGTQVTHWMPLPKPPAA